MKVELHLNGSLTIELRPENEIERLVLEKMAEGAKAGKSVTLSQAPTSGELVRVSVEK